MTLVEREGQRWLVSPYGERQWVKNARVAGSVVLSRASRAERLRIVELGSAESAPVLREYVRRVRVVRPDFDTGPDATLEAFAADASRHPVFRLVAE